MARIVTFSDSFTSASEPTIEGLGQENYEILNNATDEELFSIDSVNYKSAFFSFEMIRKDSLGEFVETGKMQLIFDGTNWNFARNISIGSEIIVNAIENPEHVVFSIQTTSGVGQLKYSSGNMSTGYEGTFRISIVRIAIL